MNSSNYNEEEFESLNDIETVLSSIGIKLRENAKEWRDIDDVLQDIADSWDNWDKTTQNAVATAVAGTRQRENVLQLFDNWDEVDKYAEIAANSYGTATEKMEAYTDSVEASQQRIKVAIEKWALYFDGSDVMKTFYDSIGYVIENLHILAATIMTVAMVTKGDEIASVFSGGIAKLGVKLSDFGMFANYNGMDSETREYYKNKRKQERKKFMEEDWVYSQQQMFQKRFNMVTKESGMSPDAIGRAKDMQKAVLGLSPDNKIELAKNLRGEKNSFGFGTGAGITYTYNSETKQMEKVANSYMDSLEAQNLATILLTKETNKTKKGLLERIKNGELLNLSDNELKEANKILAEARKDAAVQEMADEAEQSSRMGTYKDAQLKGALSLVGAGVGGFGVGSVLGNALSGIEVLGQDLGPVGEILGGTLGASMGSSAGEAVFNGIKKALTVKAAQGTMKQIIGGFFTGAGALGIAGIVVTALTAAWGIYNMWQEAQIKKAQEKFKEAEERYSSIKGSNITAKRYDELAKGVDSLGNNISLTDSEYEEFINKSNELAELFPELITRTDEAGNSFLGTGNKVGFISDQIEGLISAQKKLTATSLFEETGGFFGIGKTSLYKEAFKDAQKEANKLNNEIKSVNKSLEDGESFVETSDVNNITGNGIEFGKFLQDNGYDLTYDTEYDYEQGIDVATGSFTVDSTDLTEAEILKLEALQSEFIGNQKERLGELETSYKSANNQMSSYVNDMLVLDEKVYSSVQNLSDEEKQFLNNTLSSFSVVGRTDEEFKEQILSTAQTAIDNLNNEDFQTAIDLYFNPDLTMSYQSFETSREDLLNMIVNMFPGMSLDEQKKLLLYFGFSWDGTVDTNGNGEIDIDEIIDTQNIYNKIVGEGLDSKLNFNLNSSKAKFSVEELQESYKILRNTIGDTKYEFEDLKEIAFTNVANSKGLSETARLYKDYLEADTLTDIEKSQKNILEKQLDKWAGSLGVIEGDYDSILKKAEALGDLTYGGLTSMTPDQVTEKYDAYRDLYDYMKDEYNGTWDVEKLSQISADKDLAPLIGDPKAMTAKIKEFLDNGNQLYRKAIAEQVGSTEEGYNSILKGQDDLIQEFADNYIIDLKNFKTVQEAEATIDSYITGLMENDYLTWYNAMQSYYTDDLINFTDAAQKKAKMNSLILTQLNSMGAYSKEDYWADLQGYLDAGGNLTDKVAWNDYLSEKAMEAQKNYIEEMGEKNLQDAQDRLNKILEGNYQGIKTNFNDKNGKDSSSKTPLEKLQDAEAAINKEREAMRVFGTDKETAYFDKMKDNLSAQKAMLENLVANAESEEKRLEYAKQLEEVEVKIANLDDEEVEDKKKNLETMGATLALQIEAQRELIKTSDTEEELIERQKQLNDLLKQEQELRKNIRAYQRELIDTELEYESGTPDSKRYKELINQKQALYAEDMVKAKLAIQDARNEAYQSFKKSQDMYDDFGNAKYTDAELWDLANNSEAVQEQVKNYIEAFQGASELAMQVVEDSINVLDKKLDKLENRRPNEWTSISDINDYYDDRIELLNDKIDIWEEALEDTSNLTDEQITSLVDSLNEATKSIQEAKIARLEDIKEYDDKYYSAITWQVNQYIDEIELAKKANDKWYDDAVKKLQDYNEDLDRTNELLELQNKLKTVSQEKERVYREGLGWVYEAPRQKIKEAQDELDKFYRQDQINDLNNTKDAEDKILDERIQNWQDYLTMLENKYGEYEALENQRILMERMNVNTQEEIDAIIKKDMEDFVTYTDSKMNESIGNYYEFYTKFESWFDDFFEGYTDNLSKLAKLNEQFLSLLDLGKYLKGNGMNIEGGLATLGTLSKADRETIFKKLDMSKDYSSEMEKAIKDGNYSLAQEYALLREAKAEKKGITLGQGNYRTNEQVWDDAMKKYGKTYSEEVNKELAKVQADIQAGNAYSKDGANYASQTLTATKESNNLLQNQTGQLSTRLTDVQVAILKQTGYTVDSFEKMMNKLSVSLETVLKSLENGATGWVDGSNMSNEELEEALADGKYVDLGGGVYLDPNKKPVVIESVDKDPGVVGSQAWLEEVRKEGWSESQIASTMAQISADGIKRDAVKNVTSMKRNTEYAGKTITTGGYTVTYNDLGYAVSKVKNDSSVRDDGTIVYTSPNGQEREVTKLVDTATIENNIKTVSEAMRSVGYNLDTVGGVIASQIAASSKEAITKEQANALAQQIKSSEISNNTASLVNTSSEANQLISNMTGSIDTAISYLKNIDSKTVQSLNNSYSYSSGSSPSGNSGGGGSSKNDHSGAYVDGKYYSGMSAQGGANTDYSKADNSNSKTGTYDKYTDYSAAYKNATTQAEKNAIVAARNDKIKNEYGGKDPNPNWKKGYSSGLEKGPVTYTGLAMLHGTPSAPEYVLNNDQAYNLLYNLSMSRSAKMAEFEPKNMSNEIQYIVQGDIILEGVDNPAEFWQEVTTAMGNRWNVTKNR